jgi:homocitrate synthase
MCPHQNGDVLPLDPSEMVQVPLTKGHAPPTNGKRGTAPRINATQEKRNPYAPRAADFLSNISNFNIIESTLRGKLPLIATSYQIVSQLLPSVLH